MFPSLTYVVAPAFSLTHLDGNRYRDLDQPADLVSATPTRAYQRLLLHYATLFRPAQRPGPPPALYADGTWSLEVPPPLPRVVPETVEFRGGDSRRPAGLAAPAVPFFSFPCPPPGILTNHRGLAAPLTRLTATD